jgi:hypothetical protein
MLPFASRLALNATVHRQFTTCDAGTGKPFGCDLTPGCIISTNPPSLLINLNATS